jgi:signal transduction histidine kinase
MQSIDSLNRIHTTWIARLVEEFALSEGVRESFAGELQRFFDFLAESLRNANPAALNQILLDWSRSLTQSDFNDRGETLVSICNQLFLSTYKIAENELSDTDALALIRALLPVQSQVILFAGELEKQRIIEQITTDLDKVRNEMSRLDKSKSDFISVAAHELKTPLTLIEGYGAMLRELLQSFDANINIAQVLEGMDQGARRLRQIINDMIDVSLIDNDLLTLNFQPVWVGRMINIVKTEYEPAIRDRGQILEIHQFDGSDEWIFADPDRILQAIRNLLSNAVKYTPDGGKIIVGGRKLPGFLEITIADTGIGIDPDDQLRIFEKFNRIGDSTRHSSGKIKFKGGGPGLGLPITKGIIEAHGGTLWVESTGYDEVEYPGSIFHVLLPMHKEPPDTTFAKLFRPLIEMDKKQTDK